MALAVRWTPAGSIVQQNKLMCELVIELSNGSGGSSILGKPETGDDPLNQGNVNIDPLFGYG